MHKQIDALILAAGNSRRFGAEKPKPYQMLGDYPVLAHSLMIFRQSPLIQNILVLIRKEDGAHYEALAGFLPFALPRAIYGGEERQDSVFEGLKILASEKPARFVAIHDAARPFITTALLERLAARLEAGEKAVIPVLPVVDSLKYIDEDGNVGHSVERAHVFVAQTPQLFEFASLYKAHEKNSMAVSDDAALMEAENIKVATEPGLAENIKITHPQDLKRLKSAQMPAKMKEYRTGFGMDVHRCKKGDAVILCGVRLPAPFALEGHSDADVGLHALTDAILSTISAGDIGSHFPPEDPQWKDADSTLFLAKALNLLSREGGVLRHMDVTFLCEMPKIGPNRAEMQSRLSELTGLAKARISIKATTNEGLGAIGRGEGIVAFAQCSVCFAFCDSDEPC